MQPDGSSNRISNIARSPRGHGLSLRVMSPMPSRSCRLDSFWKRAFECPIMPRCDVNGTSLYYEVAGHGHSALFAEGKSKADASARLQDGGAPRLTPVAGYDGRVVAANLLDEQKRPTPDYAVVPRVVFTIPSLASVGLLESVARHRGLAFDVHHGDTASWYSSRRVGETHSGFKVLVEKASGRILGAPVLGPHADDVINIFAMAMRTGGTASSLKGIVFAYPTAGSDIQYMV